MKINKHVSLNLDIRGLGPSATLAINERSDELREQGTMIYKFGLGQSPFPVPPPVVEALRLHASEKNYLPVKGLPALREAVARFHRLKDHVDVQAEGVLIGPGSKELMFLLQIVFYGEIIIPTPCWVSYVPQAKILGRKLRLVSTTFEERWRISPQQLMEVCESEDDLYRPRLLILTYPNNPNGVSYSKEELKAIADVARKFEIILLSDEIYGQLNYKGEHVSVAQFYPEGTIISSGLSKWCGAGGWRLGTFSFPPSLDWLLEGMAAVASETYTSVSAPIQCAAVRAFRGGIRIERYLWHSRRILEKLGHWCADTLTQAGVRVHKPVGAFYLFPDFLPLAGRLAERGIHDSTTLCEQLLQDTGVAMIPGVSFERPPEELTARMAYVNFDGAKALTASESIPLHDELPDSFIRTWCPEVVTATEKIVDWLS